MAEPSRRTPKRPRLFWTLFAVAAVLGAAAAAGLATSGAQERPGAAAR